MTDPIAALRGQLQQLEARHRSGAIDAKAYEDERSRLERALLDHVLTAPAAPAKSAGKQQAAASADSVAQAEAAARPTWRMVSLLALAVLLVASGGYSITGSPGLITGQVPVAPAGSGSPHDEAGGEQFMAAVEALAEKLKLQPDNADGWSMLARSYVQMGRFDDAVPAFKKAVSLAGNDARLLADYADALAVQNNRSLEGEPMRLIEQALKLEPDNLKALALAGTAAFNRKDYAGAVKHWENMARIAPPDSPWREQLRNSIAEARELGGLGGAGGGQAVAGATPAAPTAAPDKPAAASGAKLQGTVRLAPALAARAAPDDVVFLFARAAEGSRMPLAIVRRQVKDLPFEFALDDAMAMSPAMKLSLFPKVVVDARVSKSGQAQPAAGDLVGSTAPIAHDAKGVVVEISEVVKN